MTTLIEHRYVVIPPVALPGGGTGSMTVELSLVDENHVPIPTVLVSNQAVVYGLGVHVVTSEAIALPVATQDSVMSEPTLYHVRVDDGGTTPWETYVQVPMGDGTPLSWAEFLGLAEPTNSITVRLPPDPTDEDDGLLVGTSGGAYVLLTAAPGNLPAVPVDAEDGWVISLSGDPLGPAWSDPPSSGLADAPLTGGPYGREGGAWADISGFTTAAEAAAAAPVQSVAGRTGAVTLSASDVPGALTAPPADGKYYALRNGAWVDITNKIIDP